MLSRSRGFAQRWAYAYRESGLGAIAVKPQPGGPTILPADQHEAFRRRVLDGACWHKSNALRVPTGMTLLFLPPYSPELMPIERVCAWMRSHDLSHRVLVDAAEIDRPGLCLELEQAHARADQIHHRDAMA